MSTPPAFIAAKRSLSKRRVVSGVHWQQITTKSLCGKNRSRSPAPPSSLNPGGRGRSGGGGGAVRGGGGGGCPRPPCRGRRRVYRHRARFRGRPPRTQSYLPIEAADMRDGR